ncbi:hypothetical protein [Microseira wollei]|uniref:Single-stranded-DNA-specific exonuclease RecJ n=1 Tax=Microseira wollei NIES-4236 TaxID=2530354 RepID=A0AAV3XFE0_9CYAN|nr:hypothetical protein [Microseira wollei]GET40213.1 single-stranded-DNA-specific exonuclease RecJ [Microseira wollei NIES-4236]
MPNQQSQWILSPTIKPPEWFIAAVRQQASDLCGNYAAQLLWHPNIQDATGKKLQYIKTEFHLWDESLKMGFPGTWWIQCDAIVEIDFNSDEKPYSPYPRRTITQSIFL